MHCSGYKVLRTNHDGARMLEDHEADLLAINAERCKPPLPVRPVRKIARSIHERTPCSPAPDPKRWRRSSISRLLFGGQSGAAWAASPSGISLLRLSNLLADRSCGRRRCRGKHIRARSRAAFGLVEQVRVEKPGKGAKGKTCGISTRRRRTAPPDRSG